MIGIDFARQDWRNKAACKGMDPSVFVVERGESTDPAKAVCATCPVRSDCLDWALSTGEKHGVLGGYSERERRKLRRDRRLNNPAPTLTETRVAEAQHLNQRGFHIDEIADRLGVTVRSAHRFLNRAERAA
jgi:WhiB family transcriptional regulator, redox-sensing transcriptional regulator